MRRILTVVALVLIAQPAWAVLPPGGTFDDDDGSVHEANIEAIAGAGITRGCGPESFCPDEPVTRGQMAAFLVRAFGWPIESGDTFTDDDDATFEAEIETLAARGVTKGCAPESFCPDDPVTRGQMAAFLVRAFGWPIESGDTFTDDDDSTFEAEIETLAARGVTKGCGATSFCPDDPVTRAQMASFLTRALGLTAPTVFPRTDIAAVTSNGELWLLSGDGVDRMLRSFPGSTVTGPLWSSDGTGVMVRVDDVLTLVLVDGTLGSAPLGVPDPDGDKVLYTVDDREALVVADADGSNPFELFRGQEGQTVGGYSWSADGNFVVYEVVEGDIDPVFEVSVTHPDGVHELTGLPGLDAVWSPTGTNFVYSAGCDPGDLTPDGGHLVVLKHDGTLRATVTDETADRCDRGPAWSADGESIAFHRATSESDDLWVASMFGTTSPRMLAEDVLVGTGWLGEEVLFIDGSGLWAIGIDGTGRRLVAEDVDTFATRR